ncbi:hypothetical protein AAFF_G00405930 [Aldrovandia affinis]|uniref:Uncharacterized protein n=1 Tax=Aldrovandia affinis TaxID=143900 RepID=A0AAD7SCL0_9TELE|nr:hypothetical protein AAFF_G00405930 [Aldrovandia affinis]
MKLKIEVKVGSQPAVRGPPPQRAHSSPQPPAYLRPASSGARAKGPTFLQLLQPACPTDHPPPRGSRANTRPAAARVLLLITHHVPGVPSSISLSAIPYTCHACQRQPAPLPNLSTAWEIHREEVGQVGHWQEYRQSNHHSRSGEERRFSTPIPPAPIGSDVEEGKAPHHK